MPCTLLKRWIVVSMVIISMFTACSPVEEGVPARTVTPTPENVQPPSAALEINGQIQAAGIGTYCWSGNEGLTNVMQCADAVGITTAREPLVTSTPYTGIFHISNPNPPDALYVTVMAVTPADEIILGVADAHRYWKPVSDWSAELPLKTDVENEFMEGPGLYVLQLDARWRNLGSASYGFLVQVGSGDNGLSLTPAASQESPGSTAAPFLLKTIAPFARLGKGAALSLQLSPNGKRLAIVTSIGLYLYDVDSLKEIWFKTFENAPTTLTFSPDGMKLAVGSKASILSILDAQTGETIRRIEGEEGIHAVWSPGGTKLLTSAGCGEVNILDGRTGTLLHTLEPAQCNNVTPGYVNAVWSWNGGQIYVNKGNGYVLAWDASTYLPLAGYKPDPPEYAFGFDITPSPAQNLFAVENGLSIALLDGDTGKIIKMLDGIRQDVRLGNITWSPDGKELVAGNTYGQHIWDVGTGKEVTNLQGYQAFAGLDWMPDGKTLVGLFSFDGDLNGVKLTTHTISFSLSGFNSQSEYLPVWDNNTLLTFYDNSENRWDLQTGKLLQRIPWSAPPNWAEKYGGDSTISPDGKRVALGVAVVDSKSGVELAHLAEHRSRDRVAWSADGTRIVSGDSLGLADAVVWDSHTGQILTRLDNSHFYLGALAWSNGGGEIAAGSDGFISLWNAQTGRQTHRLSAAMDSERVQSVAWSLDDHWLAAGTYSGRIYLWDMQTYSPVAILNGHADQVLGLNWSPDGRSLASTSIDGTVLLWKYP